MTAAARASRSSRADFPRTVYGYARAEADMVKITRRLSEELAAHWDDQPVT